MFQISAVQEPVSEPCFQQIVPPYWYQWHPIDSYCNAKHCGKWLTNAGDMNEQQHSFHTSMSNSGSLCTEIHWMLYGKGIVPTVRFLESDARAKSVSLVHYFLTLLAFGFPLAAKKQPLICDCLSIQFTHTLWPSWFHLRNMCTNNTAHTTKRQVLANRCFFPLESLDCLNWLLFQDRSHF